MEKIKINKLFNNIMSYLPNIKPNIPTNVVGDNHLGILPPEFKINTTLVVEGVEIKISVYGADALTKLIKDGLVEFKWMKMRNNLKYLMLYFHGDIKISVHKFLHGESPDNKHLIISFKNGDPTDFRFKNMIPTKNNNIQTTRDVLVFNDIISDPKLKETLKLREEPTLKEPTLKEPANLSPIPLFFIYKDVSSLNKNGIPRYAVSIYGVGKTGLKMKVSLGYYNTLSLAINFIKHAVKINIFHLSGNTLTDYIKVCEDNIEWALTQKQLETYEGENNG